MKKTPLFAILATAAFALALTACAANSANLSGTNWKLATYGPKVAQTAAASDIDTNLAFGTDGKLGGNLGCNSMGGEYTVSGQTITFKNVYSTEMACSDPQMVQEGAAFQVLKDTATFKVDGDTLTITSADGSNILTFTAIKTK